MEEINATETVTETNEAETIAVENSETAEVENVEVEIEESEIDEPESNESSDAAVETAASIDELAPKMKLEGTVSRLELYGAFIDIGVGTNALIHISKLGNEHVNRVSDVLNVGDVVTVWVDKVNPEQGQIMVTMVEPLAVDWSDLKKGQTYTGTVTRLENYGAFIDIGAEREGLVHISEISHEYVKHPSEVLTVGDEVQVEVLDFSRRKRRIDLSIKNLQEKPEAAVAVVEETSFEEEDVEEELEEVPTAMEVALRKAMGDEPVDAAIQTQKKQSRKNRKKRRQQDQDDLLSRTLQFQQDS
ncbi:MAG: S1 RNA-binding domain-containing protein [Candidatus Promineifilaceae bacterium]|jgi:small subunit ribosomal protein S1